MLASRARLLGRGGLWHPGEVPRRWRVAFEGSDDGSDNVWGPLGDVRDVRVDVSAKCGVETDRSLGESVGMAIGGDVALLLARLAPRACPMRFGPTDRVDERPAGRVDMTRPAYFADGDSAVRDVPSMARTTLRQSPTNAAFR